MARLALVCEDSSLEISVGVADEVPNADFLNYHRFDVFLLYFSNVFEDVVSYRFHHYG